MGTTNITRFWDRTVLPFAIERCCAQRSIERQREKVVPRASGRVLELGVGSGLNLAHYDPGAVEEVVGIDPSPALLERARRRADRPFAIRLEEGTAEALRHDAGSFDTVVVTYTLCSIPDPERALAEVRRVLRRGGRLLLSEHGLAPDRAPRFWQRRLDPVWHRLGGGCHLDRDVPALLGRAGFDAAALEAMYLPGPRFLNYHFWGALPRSEGA